MGGGAAKRRFSRWVEESDWDRSVERWEGFFNILALIFVFFCLFVVILPLVFFRVFR